MTTLASLTVSDVDDHFAVPFVEDIDGVWHVRRDGLWSRDINDEVRAHAACGAGICRGCFPLGRRRRS